MCLAPNSLNNTEVWQRLAAGERLLASGARGATVVFAHSRPWNVTKDGQSLLGSLQGARRASPGGGVQLINLWL